jgi:hypothetical protein
MYAYVTRRTERRVENLGGGVRYEKGGFKKELLA